MSRHPSDEFLDDNLDDFHMVVDPLTELRRELDEIDIPTNLNYENPGLMSSEFFDSVRSMEQSNFGSELDDGNFSNVDTDCGLSSDVDELRTTNNSSPDSATSNTGYQLNDIIVLNRPGQRYSFNRSPVIKIINQQEDLQKPQSIQIPSNLTTNNPNGKKVIVTKPVSIKNNRKTVSNAKQILRVQSISGKGRSVLLPFNVANMKNIKIINGGREILAENLKFTKRVDGIPTKNAFVDSYVASSPDSFDDDSDGIDTKSEPERQYPVLILSEEEKRLLSKEGICLPTHYPLTKQEERELKRIRRKIRNKISAQDSRKRKKEYVDGLEERIKQGAEEKKILMNRVKHLQQQNSRLIAQMNKLQALVFNTSSTKATPTACLLVVFLSALLISLPNMRIPQNSEFKDQQQPTARRALLSSQQATNEDSINLDEFLLFNKEDDTVTFDEDNNTGEYNYINYDKRYDSISRNLLQDGNEECDNGVRKTFKKLKGFSEEEFNENIKIERFVEKRFIEPDIDDGPPEHNNDPPMKRMKIEERPHDNINQLNYATPDVVLATISVNASRKE